MKEKREKIKRVKKREKEKIKERKKSRESRHNFALGKEKLKDMITLDYFQRIILSITITKNLNWLSWIPKKIQLA